MTVTWFPLSGTLDTMEATDYLSDTLLPFGRLKSETRRYVVGERKPHFPLPATCEWHMSPYLHDHLFLAGLMPSD